MNGGAQFSGPSPGSSVREEVRQRNDPGTGRVRIRNIDAWEALKPWNGFWMGCGQHVQTELTGEVPGVCGDGVLHE